MMGESQENSNKEIPSETGSNQQNLNCKKITKKIIKKLQKKLQK